MRLIDADALEQHCKNTKIIELFPEWKDFPYAMKIALIRYGKAWKEIIQNTPTADAAPVVRGRWEPELMPTGVEYIGYEEMTVQALRCSECGIFIDVSEGHFSFCPYCGAKMDGGVNSD